MKDYSTLFRLFETFAYPDNSSTALNDLLNHFLLSFRWHAAPEEQLNAQKKLTGHPKKELLANVFTEIGELSEGFGDPLGALYEEMVSKGHNGQFFTPEPIAALMAQISITSETPARQTVFDPACGSGRLLLAAAKINRHLLFYGADIDELCCKICVVNMLLNSLTGEIAHMDSLANHFYKGYKFATTLYNGFYYPHVIEFTDSYESRIWLKTVDAKISRQGFKTEFEPQKPPIMSKGTQGSLFDEQ